MKFVWVLLSLALTLSSCTNAEPASCGKLGLLCCAGTSPCDVGSACYDDVCISEAEAKSPSLYAYSNSCGQEGNHCCYDNKQACAATLGCYVETGRCVKDENLPKTKDTKQTCGGFNQGCCLGSSPCRSALVCGGGGKCVPEATNYCGYMRAPCCLGPSGQGFCNETTLACATNYICKSASDVSGSGVVGPTGITGVTGPSGVVDPSGACGLMSMPCCTDPGAMCADPLLCSNRMCTDHVSCEEAVEGASYYNNFEGGLGDISPTNLEPMVPGYKGNGYHLINSGLTYKMYTLERFVFCIKVDPSATATVSINIGETFPFTWSTGPNVDTACGNDYTIGFSHGVGSCPVAQSVSTLDGFNTLCVAPSPMGLIGALNGQAIMDTSPWAAETNEISVHVQGEAVVDEFSVFDEVPSQNRFDVMSRCDVDVQ